MVSKWLRHIIGAILLITLNACDDSPVRDWSPTLNNDGYEPLSMGHLCGSLEWAGSVDSEVGGVNMDYKFMEPGIHPTSIDTIQKNLLWVSLNKYNSRYDQRILKRCEQGFSTIIATDDFGALARSTPRPYNSKVFSREVMTHRGCKVSKIEYLTTGVAYNYPSQMCASRINFDQNKWYANFESHEIIATIDNEPIAIKYKHPNGSCVLLISTPLLFTNYGVFYEDNIELIIHLLNETGENGWMTLIETKESANELHKTQRMESTTDNAPMELGVKDELRDYALIGLFIAFLLFCAKRRERIIPVIEEPKNRTVSFAKQISKNYLWRKEHQAILKRKYIIFLDTLKERTNLDFNNMDDFQTNVSTLKEITGIEGLEPFFKKMNKIQVMDVDKENLIKYINKMNLIISKLK